MFLVSFLISRLDKSIKNVNPFPEKSLDHLFSDECNSKENNKIIGKKNLSPFVIQPLKL